MDYKFDKKNALIIIIQITAFILGAGFSTNNYCILSSVIFILLALSTYCYFYRLSKDIINPVGMFSLSWVGAIGLTCLKLSKLQKSWGFNTWCAFFVVYFSFEIIYIFFSQHFKNKSNGINDQTQANIIATKTQDYKKKKRILKSIILIDLISLIGMIVEWIIIGYLPVLSKMPHAYSYFHVSGVHYFTVLFALVPALSISYVMDDIDSGLIRSIYSITKKEKMVLIFGNIIAILISMCIVSRFYMMFSILLALVTYLYINKRIKIRYVLLILAGLVLGWIILSFFRHHSVNYLQKIFEFKNSKIPIWITQPYMYICNNFENFNLLILSLKKGKMAYTYGLTMLFPLFALTGLKFICPNLVISKALFTKKELTTVTMFYDSYLDFGIMGMILLPGVIAWIIAYLNQKMSKENNPIFKVLASQIMFYIILSFFTTWFSNPATWFFIVITLIINLYVNHNKA